ncbi:MAG TPA: HAD family hydrolase [Candidatus Saccharimonadia bacterium]|nr:HAD family hydrolase [Candidatus Saccharimonadia bacterium]
MTKITAVCFDVGETIVNETREYGTWADWLGVPRHTFSAVFGAVLARGGDYRETFQHFSPGFDLAKEREKRALAGKAETFSEDDLYEDARACLAALQKQGLHVALAGNQTARAEGILRSLSLPVETIGTSDGWGVEKPSPAFFVRIAQELHCLPEEILYVGDRLDNDVGPAQQSDMQTALIRRGPWGYILKQPEVEEKCLFILDTLTQLPELITAHNTRA